MSYFDLKSHGISAVTSKVEVIKVKLASHEYFSIVWQSIWHAIS